MKGNRFNEEQIIAVLREQEAGAKTADVCRKHGISSATFYIYGPLPRRKRFDNLLIRSSANIYPASPDDGAPKWGIRHTRLDKWSASKAIIEVRVVRVGSTVFSPFINSPATSRPAFRWRRGTGHQFEAQPR